MKKTVKILLPLALLFLIIHVSLILTDNTHLYKAVASTYLSGTTGPGIDDYPKFRNRTVEASKHQVWPKAEEYNKKELEQTYLDTLKRYETVAFLVAEKGELLFEQYFQHYGPESKTNSFSMAKSFVSLLTGIAIEEGYIESLDQPVSEILPGFTDDKRLHIRHLLNMTSGINFDEDYNHPLKYMARVYYGDDIKAITYEYEVREEPGSTWRYLGGNTLILAMIIEKTTGRTVSEFMQEKIWQPVGARHDALWTIDEKGLERAYCCFYSNARDFARIGQLMLNGGSWKGRQLIPSSYLEQAVEPLMVKNAHGETVDYYGLQFWLLDHKGMKAYFARGILGQYIIVIPEKDLVLVRLGRKRSSHYIEHHPSEIYDYIDAALSLI